MKNKMYLLLVSGFLFLPIAALAQQVQENSFFKLKKDQSQAASQQELKESQVFFDAFKDRMQKDDFASIDLNRVSQRQHMEEFNMGLLKEMSGLLEKKIASNTILTDAQKQELTSCFVSQYEGNSNLRNLDLTANTAFFEQTANDPDMTMVQKKAAIRAYFVEQKKGK